MLRESSDADIQDSAPDVKTVKKWSAEDDTDDINATLEHRDIVGATESGRGGIGRKQFKNSMMTRRERIAAASKCVKEKEAKKRELHLIQRAQQGQMVKWEEEVIERKCWDEIWKWDTSRLSFPLRATYDILPSPANLMRWKVMNENKCRYGKVGTLKHNLSNFS